MYRISCHNGMKWFFFFKFVKSTWAEKERENQKIFITTLCKKQPLFTETSLQFTVFNYTFKLPCRLNHLLNHLFHIFAPGSYSIFLHLSLNNKWTKTTSKAKGNKAKTKPKPTKQTHHFLVQISMTFAIDSVRTDYIKLWIWLSRYRWMCADVSGCVQCCIVKDFLFFQH